MKIITHSGNFHPDEVLGVAALRILFGNTEVIRTRDLKIIEGKSPEDIVIDVGLKYIPEEHKTYELYLELVKIGKFLFWIDEKPKIKIHANKRFPQKSYTTEAYHLTNYYLPSSSYYEVRDAHTDEIILPFDYTGSKISCDGTSSYFNLWMNSFQPERFYRIVLKVETSGGDNVQIFDNNYYFKVTR